MIIAQRIRVARFYQKMHSKDMLFVPPLLNRARFLEDPHKIEPTFAHSGFYPLLPVELTDALAIETFMALNTLHYYGVAKLNITRKNILTSKSADNVKLRLHDFGEHRPLGVQDEPFSLASVPADEVNYYHPLLRHGQTFVTESMDYYSLAMSLYNIHTDRNPPPRLLHEHVHSLPLGQFCKAYLMFKTNLL